MNNNFYVLKDSQGILRPMAFITSVGEAGESRKEAYEKKLDTDESIVVATLTENI